MHSIRFAFCALIAVPALAQFQSIVPGKATDTLNTLPGDPFFVLYADQPSPLPDLVAGYAGVNRAGRLASLGHRYFFDSAAHIFFGYDIVVQPQVSIDTYRVTFAALSLGPLDFPTDTADSLDPALWKLVPLPAIPPAQIVHAGSPMSIPVYRDPESGRALLDAMTIVAMPNMPVREQYDGVEWWKWAHATFKNGNAAPFRESLEIFGVPHAFSIDDAEMRLQMGRLIVNGKQQYGVEGASVVTGSLVWFYVPGHGRYILSLTPRPDLGFLQAGQVRGGLVTFSVDKDDVLLESPAMVAPGEQPYYLYVLHDSAWTPTVTRPAAPLLFGSVSPKELEAVPPAPKFEVASVKPCKPLPTGRGGFDMHCTTLATIIQGAYTGFDSGHFDPSAPLVPLEGGPKWITSETWRIDAKADGVPDSDLYTWALMMRSLLADRFQLKLHRESRQVPVYALTASKGGAKLQPHQEGTCVPIGRGAPRSAHICGLYYPAAAGPGTDILGVTLTDLCRDLTNTRLDRPCLDRTAITGTFDFHFDSTMGELFPASRAAATTEPSPGPAIFTAIRKYGLQFERTNGPGQFLVIDSVERPSGN